MISNVALHFVTVTLFQVLKVSGLHTSICSNIIFHFVNIIPKGTYVIIYFDNRIYLTISLGYDR